LAFQKIDGDDVVFFGMQVQEYGSGSQEPNKRRIHIAYLDSLPFFGPKRLRTQVYQEILLGYFDYVKKLGFTTAHIWACPPDKDDEGYIFYRHPPEQKIPDEKRLQEWYKRILDKGKSDGVILDYKNILEATIGDKISLPTGLPYFKGDFWPDEIEKTIKKNEEGKKRKMKKEELSNQIFAKLQRYKESFFVIQLQSPLSVNYPLKIRDPDPAIPCGFVEDRKALITMASDLNLENSSMRRCKFFSKVLLFKLHSQADCIIEAEQIE
jgi:E1A/CREB-binding protein